MKDWNDHRKPYIRDFRKNEIFRPVSHSGSQDSMGEGAKIFFLRESTYDMSNRCNIRCDGCYYYEGDKQFAAENLNVDDWRQMMRAEKARGITYVVLAGAEPSLVPELLEACYAEMPLGCIATNGFKRFRNRSAIRFISPSGGMMKPVSGCAGRKIFLCGRLKIMPTIRGLFLFIPSHVTTLMKCSMWLLGWLTPDAG